jgi:hypothetical protein
MMAMDLVTGDVTAGGRATRASPVSHRGLKHPEPAAVGGNELGEQGTF